MWAMGKKWLGRWVVLAVCSVFIASVVGCVLELESTWRDRDIVIDGAAEDWRGLTTYVEEGNLAVGVVNDDEDLYVCLHSPNREVAAQIVLRGLTVWLDPDGGVDRTLGVHCPIGGTEIFKPGREALDRTKMKEMITEAVESYRKKYLDS